MTSNSVTAFNLTPKAIESMRQTASMFSSIGFLQDADAHDLLADMLERSVKFILPEGGGLLDQNAFDQSNLDMLKLPYDVCAFEIVYEQYDPTLGTFAEVELYEANHRIALAITLDEHKRYGLPNEDYLLDVHPEGGTLIISIYKSKQDEMWTTSNGGVFVPFSTRVEPFSEECMKDPRIKYQVEAAEEAGVSLRKNKVFQSTVIPIFPNSFQTLNEREDRTEAQNMALIYKDAHEEVMSVIEACTVLNCANIGLQTIPAPEKLNKKRIRNGKLPLYEYKILQVESDRSGYGSVTAEKGSARSPRTHLRRGHLRNWKDRIIWVRPAIVNAGSKEGKIEKAYALK